MTPRLDASLRSAVKDALAGCDAPYTRALDTALAAALAAYHAPSNRATPKAEQQRRRALERAIQVSDALVVALDAVDRAWGQGSPSPAPGEDSMFINEIHGGLRHQALLCRREWSDWLDAPHTPKDRNPHRPRDERRHALGLAVVWALKDAQVPLTLSRKSDPVQDVLRVMLTAADLNVGTKDLFRRARVWVQRAQAIDRDRMIEGTRRR